MTRTLIVRAPGLRLVYKMTAESLKTIAMYVDSLRSAGYSVRIKAQKRGHSTGGSAR